MPIYANDQEICGPRTDITLAYSTRVLCLSYPRVPAFSN